MGQYVGTEHEVPADAAQSARSMPGKRRNYAHDCSQRSIGGHRISDEGVRQDAFRRPAPDHELIGRTAPNAQLAKRHERSRGMAAESVKRQMHGRASGAADSNDLCHPTSLSPVELAFERRFAEVHEEG